MSQLESHLAALSRDRAVSLDPGVDTQLGTVRGYTISRISKDRYAISVRTGMVRRAEMDRDNLEAFLKDKVERGWHFTHHDL
jgi:hypothetical protein